MNANAITAVTSRVSAAEGNISGLNTRVNAIDLTGIGANATAITAVTRRVSDNENGIGELETQG